VGFLNLVSLVRFQPGHQKPLLRAFPYRAVCARNFRIGKNADKMPTDESQVPLDSPGLLCKRYLRVRVTAS
jgi:hypothetical protein